MRHLLPVALLLLGFPCSQAQSVDQTQPYGRAAVTVVQPDGETSFDAASRPGERKSLAVYLDANTACVALVAAWSRKDGTLANGWRPELVELGEWEAQRLPSKAKPWSWTEEREPFDLRVFFVAKETEGVDKLRTLLAAMAKNESDDKLAKFQERQLSEIVAPWLADRDAVATRPANAPTRIGGTVRAVDGGFAWRDFARSMNFTAQKPAVILFRHDAP